MLVTEKNRQTAERVLRYLKGTRILGLEFKRTGKELVGMADADWANDEVDSKSYTGFCFVYGGAAVAWESKKQRTIAHLTCEAEYMALSEAETAAAPSTYSNWEPAWD